MPRGYLKQKEYRASDFSKYLIGEMRVRHITQEQMAKVLGITQQGLSYKLKTHQFSLLELLTVFDYLKTSDADILRLTKLER